MRGHKHGTVAFYAFTGKLYSSLFHWTYGLRRRTHRGWRGAHAQLGSLQHRRMALAFAHPGQWQRRSFGGKAKKAQFLRKGEAKKVGCHTENDKQRDTCSVTLKHKGGPKRTPRCTHEKRELSQLLRLCA